MIRPRCSFQNSNTEPRLCDRFPGAGCKYRKNTCSENGFMTNIKTIACCAAALLPILPAITITRGAQPWACNPEEAIRRLFTPQAGNPPARRDGRRGACPQGVCLD